jgi:hydrogenase expression/formation protein HypD
MGEVPRSGLALSERYARYDAETRFGVATLTAQDAGDCISGLILRGLKEPPQCPAFATRCTPEHPRGAPMVSAEGACAAYYHYRRSVPRTTGLARESPS